LRIPVVFIFDDGFVQAASVALTSLIVSKRDDTEYQIYILTPGLSPENKSIIESFENSPWNTSVSIIEISTEKYDSIYRQFDGNTGAGSITALLKFDIPQEIPEKKVLYLDADILVKKDLSDLFEIDISDYVAAVVKDSGKIYSTGGLREQIDNYFNSGVMLLNLDLMRNEGFTNRLIEAKKSLNNIKLVDQDAFNIAFQNRVLVVPNKFNCLWINLVNSAGKFTMNQLNEFYGTNYSCLWELEDDAYIIHFASKEKPWKYTDTPYSYIWNDYYLRSPCSFVPLDRTTFFDKKPLVSEIPIILATDSNYTPQTGITILSALENRESDIPYHFYILTPDIFEDSIMDKFKQIETLYGNCFIKTVFMGDAFKNTDMNIPHISFPTFYRLMAPALFPQYNKMIYMDSDVAVEGDLTEYFSTDLTGYYLGGVMAASYHWAPDGNRMYCEENGIPAIDQYINAGVILMNLEEMRRDGLVEKFLELVPLGLRSQDQDILNRVCYGHIKQLPYKYDAMIAKYESVPEQNEKIFTKGVINEGNNLPVITHYAAEIKPWASLSCALADRWWMYAKKSPFFEYMRDKFYDRMIENGKNDRLNRTVGGTKAIYGAIKRKKKANPEYANDLARFDELWNSKNPDYYKELYDIASRQSRYLNPQFMGRLARLYRDGKGVERNVYKAARLMKFASDAGVSWAEREYIDLLIKINDEQSASEAFDLCTIGAAKGDAFCQCRLARMYRDGVSVEKDALKAAEWMGRAYSVKKQWSSEYINLLWSIGTEDSLRLMKSICDSELDSKNPVVYRGLARCYRDGIVVSKDIDKALEYMRIGLNLGAEWMFSEYLNVLYSNSSHMVIEDYNLVSNYVGADNPKIDILLALCGLDDRFGVKNVEHSIGVLQAVVDSNPDYGDMILKSLLDFGDKDLFDNVFCLFDSKGQIFNAYMGKIYLTGVWVDRDVSKARAYYENAPDIEWAVSDLIGILWNIGTIDSVSEMLIIAKPLADKGNKNAIAHIAKAYRYGKGVKRDLNFAAELMRKIYKGNVGWTRDYADILEAIGTSDAVGESKDIRSRYLE